MLEHRKPASDDAQVKKSPCPNGMRRIHPLECVAVICRGATPPSRRLLSSGNEFDSHRALSEFFSSLLAGSSVIRDGQIDFVIMAIRPVENGEILNRLIVLVKE